MASMQKSGQKNVGTPKMAFKIEPLVETHNVNTPVSGRPTSRLKANKSLSPIKTINRQGQTMKQLKSGKRGK